MSFKKYKSQSKAIEVTMNNKEENSLRRLGKMSKNWDSVDGCVEGKSGKGWLCKCVCPTICYRTVPSDHTSFVNCSRTGALPNTQKRTEDQGALSARF